MIIIIITVTYIRGDACSFLHGVALHSDVEDLTVRVSEHKVLACGDALTCLSLALCILQQTEKEKKQRFNRFQMFRHLSFLLPVNCQARIRSLA